MATKSDQSWPPGLPGLGHGDHPLAGHGWGEAHAVAVGLAEVGVVEESVEEWRWPVFWA
jgi:hypothetical protein